MSSMPRKGPRPTYLQNLRGYWAGEDLWTVSREVQRLRWGRGVSPYLPPLPWNGEHNR